MLLFNQNSLTIRKEKGVVVYVHNSSFSPTKEIFIKPGEKTFIRVERTFIQKQPQPYSNCIDLSSYSSELYDLIIRQGQVYRQQDCFDLCFQKISINNCECYDPGFSNLNTSIRPCHNLTDIDCLNRQFYTFNLDECQTKYCPLECDTIKYDLTLSSLVSSSNQKEFNVSQTSLLSKPRIHFIYRVA